MTANDLTSLIHDPAALELELEAKGTHPGATAGSPDQSSRTLFDDGRTRLGVWECTAGSFDTTKDGITEAQHIVAGRATLHSADGTSVDLRPGVTIVTPDGWRGSWEVHETVRKVFVIWQTA
jgi:uncharacterized cupin superfamily protein